MTSLIKKLFPIIFFAVVVLLNTTVKKSHAVCGVYSTSTKYINTLPFTIDVGCLSPTLGISSLPYTSANVTPNPQIPATVSYRYGQDCSVCGTDYWNTAVCQCSGSMKQCQYHSRGCSAGACYDNVSWQNYLECGTDYWNTAVCQCSGTMRQCQYHSRGCSAGACYDNTSWQNYQECATGRGTCQVPGGCSAGACYGITNVAYGADTYNDCNDSGTNIAANFGTAGSCANVCSLYNRTLSTCNGSGACRTQVKTCASIGSSYLNANDGLIMANASCTLYSGYNCNTVMANQGYTCWGAKTWWTYCLCT